MTVGESSTVHARQTLVDETRRGDDRVRRSYRVELTNARAVPVRLELRHPRERGLRIPAESRRHTMKDGRPLWTVDLPANGRADLSYTVDVEG
jgi:hypothetical protein